MSQYSAKLEFAYEFKGKLIGKNAEAALGMEAGEFSPYEMLFGALGSCFYHTFIDVIRKKRIPYDSCEMSITGEKREEIPTILKSCTMDICIHGAGENEKAFERAIELAAKYCSVHETISKVCPIEIKLSFAD